MLKLDVHENEDTPKIRKVPWMLRDHKNVERYFEPRAVAIGPLHHHKVRYQLAEGFKQSLKSNFIEESGKTEEFLHQIIKGNIRTLKECYEVKDFEEKYSDDELATILFVDGCAALQFIRCSEEGSLKTRMKIKNNIAAFVEQDMFLLENQLPFRVLELLMKHHNNGEKYRRCIQNFIEIRNMVVKPKNMPKDLPAPVHLLDLLRTRLLTGPQPLQKPQDPKKVGTSQTTFRSITELKTTGIYVKLSSTSCLKDVDFENGVLRGKMKLPPMRVDDSTGPKFLNLVAYEMCPDFSGESEISSYVCLLDSLIDRPEDVKELRKANVLHNLLGSDEEVADLFNDIATDLVSDPDAYRDFKLKIQAHYDKRYKTWIAQGYHDHFSSPWSFLAFIGATAGLVLSLLQVLGPGQPDCLKLCSSNL